MPDGSVKDFFEIITAVRVIIEKSENGVIE
jgi:hypothetical protein